MFAFFPCLLCCFKMMQLLSYTGQLLMTLGCVPSGCVDTRPVGLTALTSSSGVDNTSLALTAGVLGHVGGLGWTIPVKAQAKKKNLPPILAFFMSFFSRSLCCVEEQPTCSLIFCLLLMYSPCCPSHSWLFSTPASESRCQFFLSN